jgi:hypothetical protein
MPHNSDFPQVYTLPKIITYLLHKVLPNLNYLLLFLFIPVNLVFVGFYYGYQWPNGYMSILDLGLVILIGICAILYTFFGWLNPQKGTKVWLFSIRMLLVTLFVILIVISTFFLLTSPTLDDPIYVWGGMLVNAITLFPHFILAWIFFLKRGRTAQG